MIRRVLPFHVVKVPGHGVKAIDTTGAGDGFVAGMLYGILNYGAAYPMALPQIIHFANAVGALTTTERGAIPALPTRATVERFIDKRMGCE